jgi:uncharacterized membrane protein
VTKLHRRTPQRCLLHRMVMWRTEERAMTWIVVVLVVVAASFAWGALTADDSDIFLK